jgi:phosphoadenosine phosphosulfate reductase
MAPLAARFGISASAPRGIIQQALAQARAPVLSTNFRPHAAALLHIVTEVRPDIPVIWVDSGYNTPATYAFAAALTARLGLNLQVYTPRVTAARRLACLGGVPTLGDAGHAEFTREVKLEPFERALRELRPDVWLTGIRADQTAHRRALGVVSRGPLDTVKVAPLYHWTEVDLENYLYEHRLPDNYDYVDPTKVRDDRECGLQHLGSGI